MPLSKLQERTLSRLERKYDKATEPTRTFFSDRADIYSLFNEGAIDQDHASLLLEQAKRTWKEKDKALKEKGKPKRQLTPISHALYRRPVQGNTLDNVQLAIGSVMRAIQAFIVLAVAIVFALSVLSH